MNASVNVERNSWRLPPDETVQVADPRSKSAQVKEVNRSTGSLQMVPSRYPQSSSSSRLVDSTIRFRFACRCTIDGTVDDITIPRSLIRVH